MSILHIAVTAEDIANGQKQKCCWCPIALAIKRITGAATVSVGLDMASWGQVDVAHVAYLPGIAREFIAWFDSGQPVEPLEFDLEVPS